MKNWLRVLWEKESVQLDRQQQNKPGQLLIGDHMKSYSSILVLVGHGRIIKYGLARHRKDVYIHIHSLPPSEYLIYIYIYILYYVHILVDYS